MPNIPQHIPAPSANPSVREVLDAVSVLDALGISAENLMGTSLGSMDAKQMRTVCLHARLFAAEYHSQIAASR